MAARRRQGDETWSRLANWLKGQKAAERIAAHILPDFNAPLKNCCKSLQMKKENLILGVPMIKWGYVRTKKEE